MDWGSYVVIAILPGLSIPEIVIADLGWSSAPGTRVSLARYVAMAVGVVFSLVVTFLISRQKQEWSLCADTVEKSKNERHRKSREV
jgi:hypothetical protein